MADPFTNEYIYLYNPLKGLFEAHGKQDFQAFAPSHLFLKTNLSLAELSRFLHRNFTDFSWHFAYLDYIQVIFAMSVSADVLDSI